MMEGGALLTITVLILAHLIIGKCSSFYFEYASKFEQRLFVFCSRTTHIGDVMVRVSTRV
jgi:hypothetical protein